MSNGHAFLLLTNRNDRETFRFYLELKENIKGLGDLFILFHQTKNYLPKWIRRCKSYPFSYDSLSELNYIAIEPSLIPGSNHFPLIEFYLNNQSYNYYWCIEDDVRFNGRWKFFFDKVNEYEHDFFSSHIKRYINEPNWYWWYALGHTEKNLSLINRLKSFNPIYRISNSALNFIHLSLTDKWFGHHEVLLPTLLYNAGYKIGDFGGDGEFVIPSFKNLFYMDETDDEKNIKLSTVRWRPIMKRTGLQENKLYHPIKV